MANVKAKIAGAALVAAVGIITFFEGTVLKTYKDPIGIWTDCVGHTGPDVKPGYVNTPAECQLKLKADLQEAYAIVSACYPIDRMTHNEVATMMSLGFNMGPGGPKAGKDGICHLKDGRIPTIRRYFNMGANKLGCKEIPKWANPPLKGIIKRRAAEEKLCLTD